MNKIFKVIWNNAKHCYVVTSELAKGYSKGGGSRSIRRAVAALGVAVAVYAATGSAIAENSGGSLDQNTGDYRGYSNFTVTIDSDVTGNVYGRRSVSGKDAEKASVTITNGIVSKNVYGGYVELEDADVSSNSVTIKGGTIDGSVFGGYMETAYGETSSNSVTISDGTVNDSVFGGMSYADNVTSNSVSISGGTIKGDILGGSSGSSDATSNSVNISGGEINNVFGGYSIEGTTASNSVNISGGDVNTIYGGYVHTGSGDSISNSVNISGGTIKDNIYGGSSPSGNVASNSIKISGDSISITGFVCGGLSYSGIAASNSVNISDGTISNIVYGGYSYDGTAASNSVYVSGGSITTVDGGFSYEGTVECNSVVISGGEINNVFGGYVHTGSGDSASNSVSISGDTTSIIGDVCGGLSNTGKAVDNSVNIIGGTVGRGVYGGSSYISDSVSNSVNISGGTVGDKVYGGSSDTGDAVSNSVNISGGSMINVFGGNSNSGNTLDNSIIISGGTISNNVYGGYVPTGSGYSIGNSVSISGDTTSIIGDVCGGLSPYGNVASNSVNISGGAVGRGVYGGSSKTGDSDSNSVIISGGTVEQVVYGGYSREGNSLGNSVNISGGSVNGYLYGGYVIEGSGNASSNSVTINSGTIKEDVYGGHVVKGSGDASSNSVTINGGRLEDGSVYGGCSYCGNVTKNYTNINGGTFGSQCNIYAGYVCEPNNSTISDNVVNLSGTVTELNNSEIYGYYFESGSGTHSGNELHIGRNADYDDEGKIKRDTNGNIIYKVDETSIWQGKTSEGTVDNSVKKIANFETIALHSVAWDNDLPAIKAAALENIGTVDITDLKFYENSSEKTTFSPNDKMNLITWESENEALINLKYKLEETGNEQTAAFSDNPNGITVNTISLLEKDKGITFEGTSTGNIYKVDKALQIYFTGITLNSIDLSDWDGINTSEFPDGWVANTDGVNVSGDFADPGLSAGESINILTASTDVFKDEKIDEAIRYKNEVFKDESAKGVTLSGIHTGGVKASDDGKILTYHAMFKDVTSFKLASVAWEDGAELLSRDKYNYSKLTTLDTEDFNITYEKPETITVNQSMTLLNANETLADMAALEKSVTYQYEPLSGVSMDAVIMSNLAAKSGKVTLTTLSNKADKLTFGNVEWLDKGALIDHKTMLNNVSFDGADVDTTRIAFTNKDEMKANMQMTLVSDFGDSVGTITGSKYKVGTAYEGEGSAYLDGSDLVFKTKTSAGISNQTHTTVMAMQAGIAALADGNNHIGGVMDGLGMASNEGSDGVSTAASVGGGSSRHKTGSHVDTNNWNIAVAVGKNLEKKDGTLEYGLFGEYGRGNYTLHMNGIEDAGSGNTHYTGGGLLLKWTNSHDVYTEASFRMGSLKDKASSLLHDGAGNAYGYDTSAKYRGGHIGFGKTYKEEDNTKLDIYGKYFYNEREGINFAAGTDQYSLDKVRSRVLRAGFRYSTTQRKWNRYGGLAYDYEFGGKSSGTVNGTPIRSASVKGGTLRGEFGYCREATKSNPWKTDISLYGFTGKRQGFGGNIAFEYHF